MSKEKECKCDVDCDKLCQCDCHDIGINDVYFGYLVGQVREVLEASISDKDQLKALKGVMDDRLYDWWKKAIDHKRRVY